MDPIFICRECINSRGWTYLLENLHKKANQGENQLKKNNWINSPSGQGQVNKKKNK